LQARRDLSGKIAHQRVHEAEFRGAWAAMQEIADWLTRLGLSEYAGAFAENGIDVSVLPHLTDQDLKDIGRRGHGRGRAGTALFRYRVGDAVTGCDAVT
jgi:SAM domain (Sterile alpha motif)